MLMILPAVAYAESPVAFTLSSSNEHIEIGDEILVGVEGQNVDDAYGYEIRLTYDPNVVAFQQATTTWEGFSVPAMIDNGNITYAHTKVGNVKGNNGQIKFATLSFKAIGQGHTTIALTRVKLVDSELASTTIEPNIKINISVSQLESVKGYTDITGHWAEEDIVRATEMGWINGHNDGTFAPNDEVTRAEFTTMLSRALALTSQVDVTTLFKDHKDIPDYAISHVSKAAAAGLIKGYTDHTFKPERWITRSEITTMLMRVLGYEDDMELSPSLTYADADEVPLWAYPAVAKASDIGIVKGRAHNRFVPNGYTTRAEAVTLIIRILDHQAE